MMFEKRYPSDTVTGIPLGPFQRMVVKGCVCRGLGRVFAYRLRCYRVQDRTSGLRGLGF